MKPLSCRPLALMLASLLAGLTTVAQGETVTAETTPTTADGQTNNKADSKAEIASSLTGQVLYQYLLAEIAASRGKLPLASSIYVDLARSTRDVRLAQRATEVAYYGQQPALALEAARLWAELDPTSNQARQTLWGLLANAGKLDELAPTLANALQAEGDNVGGALLLLNRMFSRTPDKAGVQRLVEQVSAPYLKLPEAHFARAQAAVTNNDNATANTAIDEALALKPDWEGAALFKAQLVSANPEASLAVLDKFLANSNAKEYSETRLVRARLLVELKRYAEARKAFGQLLEQQPESAELLYATGLLSLQMGDRATGEKHLRRLLDMNFADKDTVRLYLGQAAEDQGRMTEALAYYDDINTGHPRFVAAQSRAAAILHGLNRGDDAMERLSRALASNPKEKLPLLLAQAQLLSEKGKEADAYTVLDKALVEQPDEPVLLYESALLAEKLGKYENLERNLRKLIKLRPDHAQAYNALGYSYADRNVRLEEAGQLLDKALSLSPDDPFIMDSRGWLDFRLGRLTEAEAWIRKAAALRNDAEFAAHLGEVLWQQGKQDEARKVWDAAAKTDPGNALLNNTRKRLQP